MIRRTLFFCLAVLLIATAALPLLAQTTRPFSADIKFTGKGVNWPGKIFFSGEKVRTEVVVTGSLLITITDNTKKKAWSLDPELKTYMEMRTETALIPSFRSYNPANPCEGIAETTCQRVDTEIVDGQLCDKWEFVSRGKGPSLTIWISKTNGIPVKSVTAEGSTIELSNIRIGPQSRKLFKVPASYDKEGEPRRRGNPCVHEFPPDSDDTMRQHSERMSGCVRL